MQVPLLISCMSLDGIPQFSNLENGNNNIMGIGGVLCTSPHTVLSKVLAL